MKHEMLPVVDGRPPIFDKILAVLPGAADPGVIFAYGGKVWAPGHRAITRELDAHERVHIERQGENPAAWWDRYLEDVEFRFEEELIAHAVEYATYCRRHLDPIKRHKALHQIARKLAAPLYGSLITAEQAAIHIRTMGRGQP
jgi:hypothetical protein